MMQVVFFNILNILYFLLYQITFVIFYNLVFLYLDIFHHGIIYMYKIFYNMELILDNYVDNVNNQEYLIMVYLVKIIQNIVIIIIDYYLVIVE